MARPKSGWNLLHAQHCFCLVAGVCVFLAVTLIPLPANSCTRILWNTNRRAVVVGRTMDWSESTQPKLHIFPRGMERNGGLLAGREVVRQNPAKWTSKYGSVVVSAYNAGSVDGMNEKGLGMHLLFLVATDFGPRNEQLAGIQAGLWGQYLLDNAATVDEALELMTKIQPVMVEYQGFKSAVHLAIEDRSGDSAIIEFIDGQAQIHHGREFQVMTNDPPLDQQLNELQKWDFRDATRVTPVPGNVNPIDRFVRANYFLQTLREPRDEREAIATILSLTRNASVPFNAPYKTPGTIYDTEYRTVCNLTDQRFFLELSRSPNVVWVNLQELDFRAGSPSRVLEPDDINLVGNVGDKFQTQAQPPF